VTVELKSQAFGTQEDVFCATGKGRWLSNLQVVVDGESICWRPGQNGATLHALPPLELLAGRDTNYEKCSSDRR